MDVSDEALIQGFSALGVVGRSREFVATLRRLRRLASCTAPVLIGGETGTGKELAARALHYLGPRAGHPFVPVNCGAIPDALLESELFGHQRGAFTDAVESRMGLVAVAGAGTLFLDEVDSLAPRAQVVLLRFLQERRYRPVGGDREHESHATIISASNTDLAARVREGSFRRDLYFRLRVGDVVLPPLRRRGNDIELLAGHFLRKLAGQYRQPLRLPDAGAIAWLHAQRWEGNIRELENVLHRAYLLSSGRSITVTDLQDATGTHSQPDDLDMTLSFDDARRSVTEAFERRYLCELMRRTAGNISAASRLARKERRALGRLLVKHDIDRRDYTGNRQ